MIAKHNSFWNTIRELQVLVPDPLGSECDFRDGFDRNIRFLTTILQKIVNWSVTNASHIYLDGRESKIYVSSAFFVMIIQNRE